MSNIHRSQISRVLYNGVEATRLMFNRKKIWPYVAGAGEEYTVCINNKFYKINVQNNGDYNLLDGEYLGDYSYMPPSICYVDLNEQWGLSTQSRHSDMSENTTFMSVSNYHVANGVAWMRLCWKGVTSFTLKYGSYGESNYDYIKVWQMDRNKPSSEGGNSSSTSTDPTSSYPLLCTRSYPSSSAPDKTYTFTCDDGVHFIWICYRKDSSSDSNEDRGYIAIPTSMYFPEYSYDEFVNKQGELTITVNGETNPFTDTFYMLSETEYIIDDDGNYRQKFVMNGNEAQYFAGNILSEELSDEDEVIDIDGTSYIVHYYYIVVSNEIKIKSDRYAVIGEYTQSYVQLEYLWSNGNQYIDTEYVPNGNTVWELTIQYDSASGNQDNGSINDSISRFHIGTYSSKVGVGVPGGGYDYSSTVSATTKQKVILDCINKNYRVYVDDELKYQKSKSMSNTTGTLSLYLFARNNNLGGTDCWTSSKIYSSKIYNGTTLMRDLIPVKLVKDSYGYSAGKVGMLDLVNDKLYVDKKGTTAFVEGPEI